METKYPIITKEETLYFDQILSNGSYLFLISDGIEYRSEVTEAFDIALTDNEAAVLQAIAQNEMNVRNS